MKEVLSFINEVLLNWIFAIFKRSIHILHHFFWGFMKWIPVHIQIVRLIRLFPTLSLSLINEILHDPLDPLFPINSVLTLLALITGTCARYLLNAFSPFLMATRLLQTPPLMLLIGPFHADLVRVSSDHMKCILSWLLLNFLWHDLNIILW